MEGEQNNANISKEGGGSVGLIVGIIVILVIIVLGGLYFWGQRTSDNAIKTDETVESINIQSESDDTASIEADLDATNVDNLDGELNAS